MLGQRSQKWEKKLKMVFDEIDDELEQEFGHLLPLHPSRPKRGRTSNKEQDGLFNVGASFSAGYGSKYGRGYIIDIHLSTLAKVPKNLYYQIENKVIDLLRDKLPLAFPGKELYINKDGYKYKIYGDLSIVQ